MTQQTFLGDEPGVERGAILSNCRSYRYTLWRHWGEGARRVNFIMLNPSTADASKPDPIGPENDDHLAFEAKAAAIVVCAWGNGGSPVWRERKRCWERGRGPIVLGKLKAWGIEAHALRITGEGMPEHPLYLPAELAPRPLVDAPRPDLMWLPVGFDAKDSP